MYSSILDDDFVAVRSMSDIIGPLRPSDSWSTTEVRTVNHVHTWTVQGFSKCECRYLEVFLKIKDLPFSIPSLEDGILSFRLRLHPQGNKESNKDFSFFQVFCTLTSMRYRAKFSVFNARNEDAPTMVYSGTQQLHGHFEYIRREVLLNHIQPQDELKLLLTLNITFDTVTKSSDAVRPAGLPEPRFAEVANDVEKIYRSGRLADFTIVVGDKRIRAHKAILSARSPVFAGMLESHTEEFKNGVVVLEDMDHEVVQEMLLYMYSGQSPNLTRMPFELLCAADRFQLTGLKDMAEQVLRLNLTVDSACRTLIHADMYNSTELKVVAIKFIAHNSSAIITTDGWMEMVKDHPNLVTDVVSSIASCESHLSTDIFEPPLKRGRSNTGF